MKNNSRLTDATLVFNPLGGPYGSGGGYYGGRGGSSLPSSGPYGRNPNAIPYSGPYSSNGNGGTGFDPRRYQQRVPIRPGPWPGPDPRGGMGQGF